MEERDKQVKNLLHLLKETRSLLSVLTTKLEEVTEERNALKAKVQELLGVLSQVSKER